MSEFANIEFEVNWVDKTIHFKAREGFGLDSSGNKMPDFEIKRATEDFERFLKEFRDGRGTHTPVGVKVSVP